MNTSSNHFQEIFIKYRLRTTVIADKLNQDRYQPVQLFLKLYNHLRYFKVERNYYEQVHRNQIISKRNSQTTLNFKISKTYRIRALKQTRFFVFQKHIKRSKLKLRIFSIHQNYMTPIIRPSKLHQTGKSK